MPQSRSKIKKVGLHKLETEHGSVVTCFVDIESEVHQFYGNLVGTSTQTLQGIDIVAMRSGPQLSTENQRDLIGLITETKVLAALNCIGEQKASGIDGFTTRFFKVA